MPHVLAGDIGGTNARFAVFDVKKTGPTLLYSEVLESRGYKTFEAAMGAFLDQTLKATRSKKLALAAASLAIAGPVVDQRVKTTNLPWLIDARTVAKRFSIKKVTLLNDLMAVGLGAIASPAKNLVSLQVGRPKKTGGTISVIAAGTGLGEAMFLWDGQEHIACASEGGHTDFAPRNGVEDELLSVLRAEHGRVSYERIASGSTISMVYRFFVKEQKVKETKQNTTFVAQASDANRAVVELARSGKSEAAMRAIDLWCSVYGSEAGNLALKSLSTAGVFVCGGVAAALSDVLAKGLPARRNEVSPFLQAFRDKGRMRALVEAIPVAVCMEPRAGLLGAATHAASHA
jgi:glucokinase